MPLIIEGADATGKTTLAEHFKKMSGVDILHFGKPDDMLMIKSEYLAPLLGNNILDRSFVGSRVWSELGYHEPTLTEEEWREMCLLYAQCGSTMILTVRDLDSVQATIEERGEGDKAWVDAHLAQCLFLDMLKEHEVLYFPTIIMTPLMAAHIKEHQWNSTP